MPTPTVPVALANVTDALVRMLAAATGKKIGDGDAPLDLVDDEPYAIVESIPGGSSDGDVATPDGTTNAVYQVTSVGATRWQAEAMRDLCHQAILKRSTGGGFSNAIVAYLENTTTKSLAADLGLIVADRSHDSSGGITPEGVVFNAFERYVLWVTPA